MINQLFLHILYRKNMLQAQPCCAMVVSLTSSVHNFQAPQPALHKNINRTMHHYVQL